MFIRHTGRTLRKKDRQGQKSTMYNYKLIRTTTSYYVAPYKMYACIYVFFAKRNTFHSQNIGVDSVKFP